MDCNILKKDGSLALNSLGTGLESFGIQKEDQQFS